MKLFLIALFLFNVTLAAGSGASAPLEGASAPPADPPLIAVLPSYVETVWTQHLDPSTGKPTKEFEKRSNYHVSSTILGIDEVLKDVITEGGEIKTIADKWAKDKNIQQQRDPLYKDVSFPKRPIDFAAKDTLYYVTFVLHEDELTDLWPVTQTGKGLQPARISSQVVIDHDLITWMKVYKLEMALEAVDDLTKSGCGESLRQKFNKTSDDDSSKWSIPVTAVVEAMKKEECRSKFTESEELREQFANALDKDRDSNITVDELMNISIQYLKKSMADTAAAPPATPASQSAEAPRPGTFKA